MNFVIYCKKGYEGFVDSSDDNSIKQQSLHVPNHYYNKFFCYIGGISSLF